jgi:ribose/xylose/arabinose/galactoside ABC-type transport system permease subunit
VSNASAAAPAPGFFAHRRQNIIYFDFVAIFLILAATLNDKGFLNPNNLLNIVRQTAMIVAMAIAAAAAPAGMRYAGRLQSGRFQLGEGDELSVIAAAVLGGASLFGGKGTVIDTIVRALTIRLINNGLILMGLEFSRQLIARGGIIILAVALSHKRT